MQRSKVIDPEEELQKHNFGRDGQTLVEYGEVAEISKLALELELKHRHQDLYRRLLSEEVPLLPKTKMARLTDCLLADIEDSSSQ